MSAAGDTSNPTHSVVWHGHGTNNAPRAQRKQRPAVLWLTGVAGADTSTIARALESRLAQWQYHTYLLDEIHLRQGLCRDLGCSAQDQREHRRRVGELTKILVDAGLIVVAVLLSPDRALRQWLREQLAGGKFIEVSVNPPSSVGEWCERRGLTASGRPDTRHPLSEPDVTSPSPLSPEIELQMVDRSIESLVEQCLIYLVDQHIIQGEPQTR